MTGFDRKMSYWVAGAALFQLVVQLLPFFGIGGPVGQMSNSAGGPEVPAGYAFAIWGPLFVLGTAFAIFQLTRTDEWTARVRPWAALAMTMGGLWMWLAQTLGAHPVTLPVIAVMFFATLIGRRRARRKRIDIVAHPNAPSYVIWTQRWLGAQTGWLSLACLLNLAAVVRAAGLVQDADAGLFALPVLILAIALLIFMMLLPILQSDLWFGGAVLWGLAGVIVANSGLGPFGELNPPMLMPAIWAFICAAVALAWPQISEGLRVMLSILWGLAALLAGTWVQFVWQVPLIEERPLLIWALLWVAGFAIGYLVLSAFGGTAHDEREAAA